MVSDSNKILNMHINYWAQGGMSCNGIHYFELFYWFLNMKSYKIVHSSLSKFDSKRIGYTDFSEDIVLLVNDSVLCTVNLKGDESMMNIEVVTKDKLYTAFEWGQKLVTIDKNMRVTEEEFSVYLISSYLGQLITDILEEKSKLPLLEDSYLVHKILFEYLSRHHVERANIT